MSRESREWIAEYSWRGAFFSFTFQAVGSEAKAKARALSLLKAKMGPVTIISVTPTGN